MEKHIKLEAIEHIIYQDARLYYVFETKNDNKILSVTMWGNNNSIFVNCNEVKENKTFYDVITPFIPSDAVLELKSYLRKT